MCIYLYILNTLHMHTVQTGAFMLYILKVTDTEEIMMQHAIEREATTSQQSWYVITVHLWYKYTISYDSDVTALIMYGELLLNMGPYNHSS